VYVPQHTLYPQMVTFWATRHRQMGWCTDLEDKARCLVTQASVVDGSRSTNISTCVYVHKRPNSVTELRQYNLLSYGSCFLPEFSGNFWCYIKLCRYVTKFVSVSGVCRSYLVLKLTRYPVGPRRKQERPRVNCLFKNNRCLKVADLQGLSPA
jgi:hypothetical protein